MRIYAYGAFAPVENIHVIHEQLRLAHSYQCALVCIERDRRKAVEQLYRDTCPNEFKAQEASSQAVLKAVEVVRRLRTRPGDMLEPDEEMKVKAREEAKIACEVLDRARAQEKVTRQAWKDARKRATPKLRERLQACDAEARAKNKFAYNAAGSVGLAWGTRLKIGESAERAAKAAAKIGAMPHMPRFDGGGILSVQLQGDSGIEGKKGLLSADVFAGADTRFRLTSTDPAAWQALRGKSSLVGKNGKPLPQADPNSKRSQRRRERGGDGTGGGTCMIARLRIGSEGRDPIWGVWPVIIHRPLPTNAPIKWVQICAHKIGPRTEWRLLVTVDDEAVAIETPTRRLVKSTLAVNLGWRNLQDDGLRVAYAVGSDGRREEIRVPPSYVSGVAHVQSLKSIRDKLFVTAKTALREWAEEAERPEWFSEELRYMDRWLAQRKLVRFVSRWNRQRFDGDAEIFEILSKWQKKDKHLWFWESDERTKLLRMRQDFYRTVAARWASEYERILVTEMDLRDFAQKEAPEDADSTGKDQRVSQRYAAPSELRGAIKNACSTRASMFEEVKAVFLTQTCHACGIVFAFAAKTDLEHTCECGARWDQDYNHCRNLLARGEVVRAPGGSLALSVIDENDAAGNKKGRWQKRRSQKSCSIS